MMKDIPMTEYSYTVYFEPLPEGGFNVNFPAIPEICTFGRTLVEARAMAVDALRCHLEALVKDGEPFPTDTPIAEAPVKEEVAVTL